MEAQEDPKIGINDVFSLRKPKDAKVRQPRLAPDQRRGAHAV